MKRILVVNVNWRGDVLFSTPFIRAIREKHPQSFIATLLVPRCVPILENNPYLNEIIVFDEEGRHKGLFGKARLIRLLRSKYFDTVFLLHRSFTRTLLCWLAGIPERIGYFTKKRAMLLTKVISPPLDKLHKVEYFLNIAKACGIETENKDYEFFTSPKDRNYIKNLLQENGLKESESLVVINPGGNWGLKRWPKENFAKLSDRLIEKYQLKLIITGAKSDISLARGIVSLMHNRPTIFCGGTTLGQLAALMAKASLVISNDSGPMHIAVSQKTKTICLFGPTSPEITGPLGSGDYTVIRKDVGCEVPCYQLDCNDNRCMKAISVYDVLQAVQKITNENR
jgi:lipopolysaccharide heptosyltransferase II